MRFIYNILPTSLLISSPRITTFVFAGLPPCLTSPKFLSISPFLFPFPAVAQGARVLYPYLRVSMSFRSIQRQTLTRGASDVYTARLRSAERAEGEILGSGRREEANDDDGEMARGG